MERIVVIAAMDEELDAIKRKLENVEIVEAKNLKIFKGNKDNKEYIICKSGVGKVNASRTTQIMVDLFEPTYIVNVGSAGALNNDLQIGDIVIGKELVQHDFDITAFGHEKGYISETGKYFESDSKLVEDYKQKMDIKKNEYKSIVGVIASGDIFCTNVDMKNKIKQKFNADCVEMEGAAIAQVCKLNNIPFIGIRSISDTPNGNNQIDFEKFLKTASERCAELI